MRTLNSLSTIRKALGFWVLFGGLILIVGSPEQALADTMDVDINVLDSGLTIVSGEKSSSVGIDQTYTTALDKDAVITVTYNSTQDLVTILNECSSKKLLHVKILGNEYTIEPCKSQAVLLSTAEEGLTIPETPGSKEYENTSEGREPISPVQA